MISRKVKKKKKPSYFLPIFTTWLVLVVFTTIIYAMATGDFKKPTQAKQATKAKQVKSLAVHLYDDLGDVDNNPFGNDKPPAGYKSEPMTKQQKQAIIALYGRN
jgi:hypothetical protein